MNNNLRLEEYYPGGRFLKASFDKDRAALVVRFSEFTPDFQTAFEQKLVAIKTLEQSVVLSDEQKGATAALDLLAGELNNELNFLGFYFKRAGLDKALVSAVKKDLSNDNIEGATDKLEGVIQYVVAKQALLVSKGMSATFAAELGATRDALNAKNELQNEKMNALKTLHKNNSVLYKELYGYISAISEAGKIMYKGDMKADEYTVQKLIKRMRSAGGGKETGTPLPQ